jgi:hypothetical protein
MFKFGILVFAGCLFSAVTNRVVGQDLDSLRHVNELLDSIFIAEVEKAPGRPKVLHAEPLFTDLIRDLGARKGEKEWNVGLGMADRTYYNAYHGLVEYEFAPVNRLGVEFEIPFSVYLPSGVAQTDSIPENRIHSLKAALQYTFHVSERHSTSAAIGMIYERTLHSFTHLTRGQVFDGHLYQPFFVFAKRWGRNFHSLWYLGPHFFSSPEKPIHVEKWQVHSNLHYMISGTRNFIGIEITKEYGPHPALVFRPQMRVGVTENLLVGIVSGIPVQVNGNERLSSFLRVIYEPKHYPHGRRKHIAMKA